MAAVSQEITVAAASDLQPAFKEIAADFERKTGVKVRTVFGSSGNFFSQIENGAPYDIYFSADVEYPRRLVAANLAEGETWYIYAVGKIVLWAPHSGRLDLEKDGLKALLDPWVRKVAIANPAHAPYGKAAQAAMQSAGVYEAVKPRLVLGDNISQAAAFVKSGSAQAGVLSISLALTPELQAEGKFWMIPQALYARLEQAAVVVTASKKKKLAERFLEYLRSPDAQMVMKKFGFEPPVHASAEKKQDKR